jgi:outer membrane protein TolC
MITCSRGLAGAGLAVLFLLNVVTVFGQEPAPTGESPPARKISPDEAVALAVKNNLSLQSSQASVDAKKRKMDTRWNVFSPTVDLSGTFGRMNTGSTVSGTRPVPILGVTTATTPIYGVTPYSVESDPAMTLSGRLSVSLSLNAALFEGMQNTKLDYEGGLITYEKAKAQLERDVRKAYYNMLLMRENIKLKRESYVAAEQQEASARANYRAGLSPELNLLQAQVAKENLKPEIDELENNYTMLFAQFAVYLGLPYDTAFELEPLDEGATSAVPLEVKELIAKAANNKPEIQELKQQVKMLESTRKKTFYNIFTPTLSLSWNMDPTWRGTEFGTPPFESNIWKAQQSGMFSVMLSFRLSGLFPWSAEQQSLKDIDDQIRSLNIGLAQSVQGAEIDVYKIILSLNKAQASIGAMNKTIELAQRSYESTERAYRAGLQNNLQVQDARNQLNQAKIGALSQQFTYLQGLLDLEYAIGVPFGTLSGGTAE